ncbi:beta-2-glycoprotein 1-like [Argopecten irradians]|uniref:beta-2-glycoprotein 1-like n=1 Tax=Argopecten irradians TaxID=31199 RepID=UPI003717EA0D
MSGNPNVKCVATGTWTLPSFSCAGCPSPPNLTNGDITAGESLIGTERIYTCKSGYTSGGSDIKTSCGNDLTWTALTGSCSPVDCGTPPTLSGGSIDTSTSLTTYPVTRSYSCNTGYTTNSGSGSISCQSSGSWSSLALTCTAIGM